MDSLDREVRGDSLYLFGFGALVRISGVQLLRNSCADMRISSCLSELVRIQIVQLLGLSNSDLGAGDSHVRRLAHGMLLSKGRAERIHEYG